MENGHRKEYSGQRKKKTDLATSSNGKAAQQRELNIISDYVSDPISSQVAERARNIMTKYADYSPTWVWSPNWGSRFTPTVVPSGFSFRVPFETKLIPQVFSPTKMFYGTAAISLEDAMMKDGKKLSESYIINNIREISKKLDLHISQTTETPISLATHFDAVSCAETKDWKECLGGSGSYAGIFVSTESLDYVPKPRFWLVVQAGNTEASEELYRHMEEVSPMMDAGSNETWESFFMSNDTTVYVHNAAKRTRARLLARLADALNLKVDMEMDPSASSQNIRVMEPTIETISYDVNRDPSGQGIIYHSATVDPFAAVNGLIQNSNPYRGPVILRGPPDVNNEFGSRWSTTEGCCGAFPTGTGRTEFLSAKKGVKVSEGLDHTRFVWEGKKDDVQNLRLNEGVYRMRDFKFQEKEKQLGYQHTWGSIELKPLLVKLACDSST